MAKVNIKFLTAHIADNQVEIFLKKMEEVLKNFSGDAYNFRHEVEWASSKGISKIPGKKDLNINDKPIKQRPTNFNILRKSENVGRIKKEKVDRFSKPRDLSVFPSHHRYPFFGQNGLLSSGL
jgi:hypothetical protein